MAKKKGGLTTIGMLLAVIGAVLAIVYAVLGLLEISVGFNVPAAGFLDATLGTIVTIVVAVLVIMIYMGRIKLEGLVLGIVILILGLVGDGILWLAALGGILIILDEFI